MLHDKHAHSQTVLPITHSQSVINTHEQKTPNHKASIHRTSNHNTPIPTTKPITMQPFTQHPFTTHPFMQHTQSQCSHSHNTLRHNTPICTTCPVTMNQFTQHTHSQCTLTQHIHSPLVHPFTGEVYHIAQVENPCTLTLWTDYDEFMYSNWSMYTINTITKPKLFFFIYITLDNKTILKILKIMIS